MATATRAKKATAAKAKPAPEPEPEEIEEVEDTEEEFEEFEEVEESDVAEAPAKAKGRGGQPPVAFGVKSICDILTAKTGKEVTTRELRTLIRKMARDGSKRVDREIVAGNRAQYSWSGPNDPEVKAIIAAYTAGEGEQLKKEQLANLKEKKAAVAAAKPATAVKAKKAAPKAKPAPVVEEVEEELDEDFDDELDED